MKAIFLSGYPNARLLRNQLDKTKTKPREYVIEKTILLCRDDFIYLRQHLLEYDINIASNKDKMFIDENGIWHCVMFCSTCADIMLLVNSKGYDYAKYVSIITNGGEQIEKRFAISNRYIKMVE